MIEDMAPTKVGKIMVEINLSHRLKPVAKNLNYFADIRRNKFIGVSSVAKNLNCFSDARRGKFIGVSSVAKNLNCFSDARIGNFIGVSSVAMILADCRTLFAVTGFVFARSNLNWKPDGSSGQSLRTE